MKGLRVIPIAAVVMMALGRDAFCGTMAPTKSRPMPSIPPAVLLPSDAAATEGTVRFLERRVKKDPEDFIALNKLAGLYLQRVRETGDVTYLNLASRAVHASLATLPAEKNTGGLAAKAQVEYASHDFVAARDHARLLTELEPGKGYPFQILGDALLELGEYDEAKAAFQKMEQLGGIQALTRVAAEQRTSRLAALRGDPDTAGRSLAKALTLALAMPVPPRETVAWCRWQLGEVEFSIGDYPAAERHDRDALTTFPDYFRAVASLGHVRAARGDLSGAIQQYERAVHILPDPAFVAALGDLYHLAGREKEAVAQYALVEQIGRLASAGGSLYNRQLALFYADHDMKPVEAYAAALKEYEMRRDIYGADALAWTALKAGKIAAAQAAIRGALHQGTRDAKLHYHAGMIALAVGNMDEARRHLRETLAISPNFDPIGARNVKAALESLGGEK